MGRTKGLADHDDDNALQPVKPPSRPTVSMMPYEFVGERKDDCVLKKKNPAKALAPTDSLDPVGPQTHVSSITQPSVVEELIPDPPSKEGSLDSWYPPPSSGVSMIPQAHVEELAPQHNPANEAKQKLEAQIATKIQEEYQRDHPDAMESEHSNNKPENSSPSRFSSSLILLLLLLLLVVGGAVGAFVALAGSKENKSDRDNLVPNPRREYLLKTLGPSIAPNDSPEEWALFDDPSSPQAQALRWMSEIDTLTAEPEAIDDLLLLERYAITVFYYSTSGSSWGSDLSFLNGTTGICNWNHGGIAGNENTKGVLCTKDSTEVVTYLALHDLGLTGTIPWEISLLENLVSLYLESNALSGSLPAQIGDLSSLRQLWLDSNALSGTVPIAMPASMKDLSLTDNMMSGTIPSQWGRSMPNLVSLYLGKNEFTGTLPTEMGNLISLEQLFVHENYALEGSIPKEFGNLSDLQEFWFHRTELTGSVDSIFCDILSSAMPSSLWGDCMGSPPEIECTCCDRCCSADGDSCSLNAVSTTNPTANPTANPTVLPTPAPTTYSRRTYLLQTLGPQIAPNDSPAEWALFDDPTTPQAQALTWMSEEDLFSAQPESLSSLVLLERYALAVIYFSTSGSNWSSGTYFLDPVTSVCEWNDRVDSDDDFKGTYCVYDDGLVSHLILDALNIQQTIPWEVTLLQESLYAFSVYDNYLTGSIPTALLTMGRLTWLDLGYNIFIGSITTEIGFLTDMQYLYLQQNYLTGTIPTEIGSLSNLVQLTLHYNSDLSGTVPEEIKELEYLEDFYFHGTSLTGSVDPIFCADTSGVPNIAADCLGSSPEMECSCCVYCCDSDGESCSYIFVSA